MRELFCTTEEFKRILAEGEIPERFRERDYLRWLDFHMDQLVSEYVNRTMHDFFGGMQVRETQRQQVILAILHCAEVQGLVLKEEIGSDLTFASTDRLHEFWGDMYGEIVKGRELAIIDGP
jgi:hypothetical protein